LNIEDLRIFCLSLKGVEEGFPFGEQTLVFKVMGKMFCLSSMDRHPFQYNLKCDPEKAIVLREEFSGVVPGWHMNKKHWNTVVFDGSFSNKLGKEWIKDSYNLVVHSLSKKQKDELHSIV